MGGRVWSDQDTLSYARTSQTYAKATSARQVFTQSGIHENLDPSKWKVRESRNSPANPQSTPIILGLDVTGSMGEIARLIAANGLGTLITEIFARKPVTDPHIMFAAIGDVNCDRAPLQASQFETDIKMMEQLGQLYVEGGGGGNGSESYTLPWHMAAFHTSCDAFEKDNRKGFIFTFGDEGVPPELRAQDLQRVYGRAEEPLATNRQLLEILADRYHVFHLRITQGHGYSSRDDAAWKALLGERALDVTDYTKLAEIIVSTMQVVAGATSQAVASSWSGDTSVVVANAIKDLSPGTSLTTASTKPGQGLVRF